MRYFILLLLICLLSNCKEQKITALDGIWILDKIEISHKDCRKYFQTNTIVFESETKTGGVPGSVFANRDEHIKWDAIITKNTLDSIKISSKNPYFNTKFKVSFMKRDERFYIRLVSDSVCVEGYNPFYHI